MTEFRLVDRTTVRPGNLRDADQHAMTPVLVTESAVEIGGLDIVLADRESHLLTTFLDQVLFDRFNKFRADTAIAEFWQHFKMSQQGHTGQMLPNIFFFGGIEPQIDVTDRHSVQPGDQQHATIVLLPLEALGEVRLAVQDTRQCGNIGVTRRPDVDAHRSLCLENLGKAWVAEPYRVSVW